MRGLRSTLRALAFGAAVALSGLASGQSTPERLTNPALWTDVPDVSVLRVGSDYYMSSTTMHMSPGVPVMRSSNLADWDVVGYAYMTLSDADELTLSSGKNAYGSGSWASSLRFHDGKFWLATFSGTTGMTYIFSASDPSGEWEERSFRPMFHDCSLFFDDDGRAYLIHGSGDIRLTELTDDLSGVKRGGVDKVLIKDVSGTICGKPGLGEGSQAFKHDGWYYITNITWPAGGMRTQVISRSRSLEGPYEGRKVVEDRGIAQGTFFDDPDGNWFVMLFQDAGAVGRIPYIAQVEWHDGWPEIKDGGRFPDELPIAHAAGRGGSGRAALGNIVGDDEFDGSYPLTGVSGMGPWQWNHNPAHGGWSLTARPGALRLTSERVDATLTSARNMLTQRTFGPECSGETSVDAANLQDGDVAGLALLQRRYGYVGILRRGNKLFVVQSQGDEKTDDLIVNAMEELPGGATRVRLRARCDFRDRRDLARFEYSADDGESWRPVGKELRMIYTLPHFMGYRFGLFLQSTKEVGGHADFDYFHISD